MRDRFPRLCSREVRRSSRAKYGGPARGRDGWKVLMQDDIPVEVSALAINVTVPESLRWTSSRRGQTFSLTTLNVRLLPDGHLAMKAYGRPVEGGRGAYVSFPVPDDPALVKLAAQAASRAGQLWAAHRGLG